MIKLGSIVKDITTGIKGRAIGRTVWEHGCVRITLQPAGMNKDGKAFDTHTTDEQNIEVLKEAAPNPKPSGGPMQAVARATDPKR